MRPPSRLAVATLLLVLSLVRSGAVAAPPVAAMFSGVMTDKTFDFLGAYGAPEATRGDIDLTGAGHGPVDFNTLPYSASRQNDLYTVGAPGGGVITLGISVGDATLTQAVVFNGLLRAIGMSDAAAVFGAAGDAHDDVLGYSLASATIWSAGVMDSSAGLEALVPAPDPGRALYLLVDATPGQWDYMLLTVPDTPIFATGAPFFASAPEIIAEPTGWRLLPVGLLALGILSRRPSRGRSPAGQVC